MEVRSIGWRTDIALRRHEGAQVTEHGDHVLVRSPSNPGYRWGNFLLVCCACDPQQADRWMARFQEAFPRLDHVAIGLDTEACADGGIDGFTATGMESEVNAVLAAETLRAAKSCPAGTELRRLDGDDDWGRAVALRLAVDESGEHGYREFLELNMRAIRGSCERGHGSWFGAFRAGAMVCNLGVFDAGEGVARFQAVDTHPEYRRQGFASNLLVHAGAYARTHMSAQKLVIVADPNYFAIDMYRSLGFVECDRQAQVERVARS